MVFRCSTSAAERYRVWIVQPQPGQSGEGGEQRSALVALEPAEPGTMSVRQAGCYVEAFNRAAQRLGRTARAVAVAVGIQYEGDLLSGRPLPEPESPEEF